MANTKLKGTEIFIDPKHEDLYQLSLVIQNQLIHTHAFNLTKYSQMINYLKQNNFLQNADYSLDPNKESSIYITRWEAEGVPSYCFRAVVNGSWSGYSMVQEKDLKDLAKNLESLIIYKEPVKTAPLQQLSKPIVPMSKIENTQTQIPKSSQELDALKQEMLKFLDTSKKTMKGQ